MRYVLDKANIKDLFGLSNIVTWNMCRVGENL